MRSTFAIIIFCLLAFTDKAFALVQMADPVAVSSEIAAWDADFATRARAMQAGVPETGFTECRETSEIPGTYLCLSDTQEVMNTALVRASLFVEGLGGVRGQIVPQDDYDYRRYKNLIGGHDLRAADLLRFYEAAEAACVNSGNRANHCLNPNERELFDTLILPQARANSNFVIITFAHISQMRWQDVVTHEILHAQYFSDSRFSAVVTDFWQNQMSEDERARVRRALSEYYDADDELLMKNEFQAYMLYGCS